MKFRRTLVFSAILSAFMVVGVLGNAAEEVVVNDGCRKTDNDSRGAKDTSVTRVTGATQTKPAEQGVGRTSVEDRKRCDGVCAVPNHALYKKCGCGTQ